jgi:hypothetical protein
MDPYLPELHEPRPDTGGTRRKGVLLSVVFCLVAFCVARPEIVRAAMEEVETILALKSTPVPASPAKFSKHLAGELEAMTPQAQGELLLEESLNHYGGAIEMIEPRLEGWRGILQLTPRLSQLLETAMNSNDLRVRAAALEIYLDAYDIRKDSSSVSTLEQRVADEPGARPWALWMLGALGNRGVEPIGVLREELNYVNDSSEETRVWAIEGLAILGSDEAMGPLLDSFRNDPSPRVRERAACGLAQSGMFTEAQRMTVVPRLLEFAEDPGLDAQTRGWVYHALQDITGASLGSDPQAWHHWWNEHHS